MNNRIKSFKDLIVYTGSIEAAKRVMFCIVPLLPQNEKYDLASQLRRCCKAIPTLIAEGYAKKYQPKAFKKYLEDALGEANEMHPHLVFCRDIYLINPQLCSELISTYEIIGKQLFCLRRNWQNYGKE